MGTNNRQRRAAKNARRRKDRPHRPTGNAARRPDRGREPPGADGATHDRPPVDDAARRDLIADLMEQALVVGKGPLRERLVDQLCTHGSLAVGVLQQAIARQITDVWRLGYTPTDLLHVVGRQGSAPHRRLVATTILADPEIARRAAASTAWADEVDQVVRVGPPDPTSRATTGVAIEVLGLLRMLRPVQPALAVPGSDAQLADDVLAGSGLDATILARVRALLAKAESTEFEPEAEALTAKAQELIAVHAIDRARLAVADGPTSRPTTRRILLDDPYVSGKSLLVHMVATANRCQSVYDSHRAWCTLVGFSGDLAVTELLSASLLAQAVGGMVRCGRQTDRQGRSSTRSFRTAFLHGFSVRIGERLARATADAVASAADQDVLLPVLASREAAVTDAVAAAFPALRTSRPRVSNAAGWAAGASAADLASLDAATARLDK